VIGDHRPNTRALEARLAGRRVALWTYKTTKHHKMATVVLSNPITREKRRKWKNNI
jgi:hypothetical protein